MAELIIIVVTGIGSLFVLLAAIGIIRMPDFYLRVSVTTKAATLGIGLLLLGAAVFFNETSVTSKVIAIIFFLLLTAPVSAHMIGRSSYFIRTKLWKKTLFDEMKGQYEPETHILKSGDELPPPHEVEEKE